MKRRRRLQFDPIGEQCSFAHEAAPAQRLERWSAGHAAWGGSNGFTLFELLLVLAIMTLVIGFTWPSLDRLFAHHQLRQSVDLLSARLAFGRVCALETGLAYQFRYEPGGRRFLLVPFDKEFDVAEGSDEKAGGKHRARRVVGMLPAVCRFEGGDSFSDKGGAIPDEWLSGLPDAGDYSGALWSGPVLFHPDGTATNFEVVVRGRRDEQVRLTLRGLTSGVTVAPVAGG